MVATKQLGVSAIITAHRPDVQHSASRLNNLHRVCLAIGEPPYPSLRFIVDKGPLPVGMSHHTHHPERATRQLFQSCKCQVLLTAVAPHKVGLNTSSQVVRRDTRPGQRSGAPAHHRPAPYPLAPSGSLHGPLAACRSVTAAF